MRWPNRTVPYRISAAYGKRSLCASSFTISSFCNHHSSCHRKKCDYRWNAHAWESHGSEWRTLRAISRKECCRYPLFHRYYQWYRLLRCGKYLYWSGRKVRKKKRSRLDVTLDSSWIARWVCNILVASITEQWCTNCYTHWVKTWFLLYEVRKTLRHFFSCCYRQLGEEHNLDKHNLSDADTLSSSYDYESVMHYARDAFSVNGSFTIIPRNSAATIGQRITLSPIDILQVQRFYKCQTTATTAPTGKEKISLISRSRISVPGSVSSQHVLVERIFSTLRADMPIFILLSIQQQQRWPVYAIPTRLHRVVCDFVVSMALRRTTIMWLSRWLSQWLALTDSPTPVPSL